MFARTSTRSSLPYIGYKRPLERIRHNSPLANHVGIRYNGSMSIRLLTVPELTDLLAADPAVDLIDVRDHSEWELGHIDGVRLVPLAQFVADPEAHLTRGKNIVFICAKGVRSLQAAKLAERFGYERVSNLEGGTKAWASAGLPIVVETRAAA